MATDQESLCDALLPMPLPPYTGRSAARRFMSLFTVSLFLFSILWVGVQAAKQHPGTETLNVAGGQVALGGASEEMSDQPDFSQYVDLATLTEHALRSKGGRLVFVGDIHGMYKPLQQLLKNVRFDPAHDTLVHSGDIIVRGPHSRKVLQELILLGALGVRGNQDQRVVEWRGWIEWILSQEGGKTWLHKMDRRVSDMKEKPHKSDYERFRKIAATEGWKIPDGWQFGSEVYRLARHLKPQEYQYLLGLPIALHIPSLHTITVHAGILPMDPQRKFLSKRQPLSHPPKINHKNKTELVLRNMQELALLSDIPQNTNPWAKLNMRSIKNGKVSRKNGGTPWAELWHKVINLCDGFDAKPQLGISNSTSEDAPEQDWAEWVEDELKGIGSLPCKDVTVVYGHAAARGLDIKKWSKGLDSGCIYNLKLTALVLGKRWKPDFNTNSTQSEGVDYLTEAVDDETEGEVVSFGPKGRGKVVQVRCTGGITQLR